MSKNTKSNQNVAQIFEDLSKYRKFCSEYGYQFDEAELYNSKSYPYRQFQKFIAGKPVKNQWEIDYSRWKEQEATKTRY
jgi:hypothetical protein